MKVKFLKMHGIGNDFILIDCITQKIDFSQQPDMIKRLCSRRFGIGADQVLLLYRSDAADYKMRILNADGGEVEMCGNGIRCLAKYINSIDPLKKEMEIETLAGIIKPRIIGEQVEVDMGCPELEGDEIPVRTGELGVNAKGGRVIDELVTADGIDFKITCVSMGNPHCIIFCDNVEDIPLERYGPLLETHLLFQEKTNVEFVEAIDRKNIKMRVWERGSGITLACGTGACASAVAAILNNRTEKSVKVLCDGGTLDIRWGENNHVYMTGPAEIVFWGEVEIIIRRDKIC